MKAFAWWLQLIFTLTIAFLLAEAMPNINGLLWTIGLGCLVGAIFTWLRGDLK